MVVMAVLASAKCCIGRRRCSSMPKRQPAKIMQPISTARLAKIIANSWQLDGAHHGRGARVAWALRRRQLAGDAEATNDGSSLGGEQVDRLLGIGQGFPRPEPGGRR